jgi:hypothetical protein
MSGRFALPLAIALAACAWPAQTGTSALPADVAAFIQRRDACDHLRGEEPYDAARAAELKRGLAENCTGTDRELAALRRKYAAQARVMKRLSRYEDQVE